MAEWINIVVYQHMEYYSAVRRNKLLVLMDIPQVLCSVKEARQTQFTHEA